MPRTDEGNTMMFASLIKSLCRVHCVLGTLPRYVMGTLTPDMQVSQTGRYGAKTDTDCETGYWRLCLPIIQQYSGSRSRPVYKQVCIRLNKTHVAPCGCLGESVRALDDKAEITAGIVATYEGGNRQSIEVEASITEEQVPVEDTTDVNTGDNIIGE